MVVKRSAQPTLVRPNTCHTSENSPRPLVMWFGTHQADTCERQMTMMLAGASMPLSRQKASKATDPAATAAPMATPASTPSQPRVSQDSSRAGRARRSHSGDLAAAGTARPAALP